VMSVVLLGAVALGDFGLEKNTAFELVRNPPQTVGDLVILSRSQ